jgi:hypothetical protein
MIDEAEQATRDEQYREYLANKKRKAKRGFPDWNETDPYGNPIFPPSRIFEQTIPIEPPSYRRKRIKSK